MPIRPIPEPARAVDVRLPIPLSSLVGRAAEVATLRAMFRRPDVRLVTLTGPGGVGKTHLALQAAAEILSDQTPETGLRFADGGVFVSLAEVGDPALVALTVAGALGIAGTGDRTPERAVQSYLGERSLLLLLDNCEHLLPAAPLVTQWLQACPGVAVLATSRAALRLTGEHDFALAPLAFPDLEQLPPLDALAGVPAVQLFVERARAARSDFTLTSTTGEAVAAICARLDGLPLAIELAAAHVKHLPPHALLTRLEHRLSLLTGGPRDQPARLRTLRDAVAWSYDHLTPEEQALFRRVAVFVGAFTLEGAAAVGGGDVFDELAALVGSSLLRQVGESAQERADGSASPRYRMLDTIREYALERLAENDEADEARRRHAAYFVDLAERADPAIWGGAEHRPWLDRLEMDLPDCRAALTWLERSGDHASFLRLAAALGGLWHFRSYRLEGRDWVRRALALDEGGAPAARATALIKLALLNRDLDGTSSIAPIEEAIALRRQLGLETAVGRNLMLLATMIDAKQGAEHIERVVSEAQVIFERLEDGLGLGYLRAYEGMTAFGRGELDRARDLLAESLALVRGEGLPYTISCMLLSLGGIEEERGDLAAALGHYAECLDLWEETGSRECVISAVAGAGRLALVRGRLDDAARLLGAAAALGEALGYRATPHERARNETAVAWAQAVLGETDYLAARDAGAALPFDLARAEAAALLADLTQPATPAEPQTAALVGLTRREVEVIRLIAAGRSNREIAESLFVSQSTAISHVRNIFAKLGLDSRAAIAAWAVRHGLA